MTSVAACARLSLNHVLSCICGSRDILEDLLIKSEYRVLPLTYFFVLVGLVGLCRWGAEVLERICNTLARENATNSHYYRQRRR